MISAGALFAFRLKVVSREDDIISYTVDLKHQLLKMYWKNEKGEIIRSIQNLKKQVEDKGEQLVFAMNGGMFMENRDPLGLFIQDGAIKRKLNTAKGSGNFYINPNGVE
jgi:uncharacterized protein YigE (DUF2233 family)